MSEPTAPGVGSEAAETLRTILLHSNFEVVPLKNALDQAAFLPAGTQVSVTASPTRELEATVDLSRDLAARGFTVVPHLAARMIRDRPHLTTVLEDLRNSEIDHVFVVGGDADQRGEFRDGLALLEAMDEIEHGLTRIGIAAYPEGHAFIPDADLWNSLIAKQQYADYMVTQMCFDPEAITAFIRACRSKGITLPALIGLTGVARIHKLAVTAARLGVGPSRNFLSKHTSLLGKLVRPGGYAPDELIRRLIPAITHPETDIRGFHIYTFNQVESTEAWRRRMLAELDQAD